MTKSITAISDYSLDIAAGLFEDFPCEVTAKRYEQLAMTYYAAMVITLDELENILNTIAERRQWRRIAK